MRRNSQPNGAAAARASIVLPIPQYVFQKHMALRGSATAPTPPPPGLPTITWFTLARKADAYARHLLHSTVPTRDRRALSLSTPRRHAPAHPWPLPIAPPFDPFLKSIRRNSAQTSRKDRTSSPHGTLEPYLTSTYARVSVSNPCATPDTPRSARQRIKRRLRLTASIPVRRRPHQPSGTRPAQKLYRHPRRGADAETSTPTTWAIATSLSATFESQSKRTTQAFHIRCAGTGS